MCAIECSRHEGCCACAHIDRVSAGRALVARLLAARRAGVGDTPYVGDAERRATTQSARARAAAVVVVAVATAIVACAASHSARDTPRVLTTHSAVSRLKPPAA